MTISIKKITLMMTAVVATFIISCDNDDAITQSVSDVSSRITGFSSEITGPGATFTINGTELGSAQRIVFGSDVVPARSMTITETGITFNVPLEAAFGQNNIVIMFPGGERAFSQIKVVPLPAISSFTPYTVSVGETVTLVGVNFDIATGVKVGDLDATIISQTPTAIKFAVPEGIAANKITVTSIPGNAVSEDDLIPCSDDPSSLDCMDGLNLNTGFEEGTGDDFTDWVKNGGGAFMVATTQPGEVYGGSRALKVIRDGSLPNPWSIQLFSNPVTTEIGKSYTIFFWAKASSAGGGVRASLNRDTGYYGANTEITTDWQLISFVVPSERIQDPATRFVLDLNVNNTAVTTFFIDNMKVIKTPTP